MKVVVVGAGYVGLVTGVMLANSGHNIVCIDVDSGKITKLLNGLIPIYEPGLEEFLFSSASNLRFTTDYDAARDADIAIIAVGTPQGEDGAVNLSYLYKAAAQLLEVNTQLPLLIKSTVTPGTCAALKEHLKERFSLSDVAIISNPEFLREGSAVEDYINPDRIVVGADDKTLFEHTRILYKDFIERGVEVFETNLATAELIKHASNALLATRIAFINEMANLCENVGADVDALATGMGLDRRIGRNFLQAGPGFGGSCFPKDIAALAYVFRSKGDKSLLLDAVIASNNERPIRLVQNIIKKLPLGINTVGVLGLSFKANTDDVRESPAIAVIKALQKFGMKIIAYDPVAGANALMLCPTIKIVDNPYEIANNASAIVVLTEWHEFKNLDYGMMLERMMHNYIFDLRNMLDGDSLSNLGFVYTAIGK